MIIKKTALVLEGGGFRGIFTAGVLDVLLQNQLYFDYAVGVSAGASYGVSYVTQQPNRNLAVNQFIADKRYAGFGNYWREGSYFSWPFIFDTIPKTMVSLNYEALRQSPTKFWIGTTNCITGEAEYFLLNTATGQDFVNILAASCSLPLIAPMVKLNQQLYMDGGLSDSIPFEHALAQGNNKAVVVLTRPHGYVKKPVSFPALFKWYYRKYPKLVDQILLRPETYNASLQQLSKLEAQGKVLVIRPTQNLTVSRLENNPQKTEKVYYEGMAAAKSMLPALRNWLTV